MDFEVLPKKTEPEIFRPCPLVFLTLIGEGVFPAFDLRLVKPRDDEGRCNQFHAVLNQMKAVTLWRCHSIVAECRNPAKRSVVIKRVIDATIEMFATGNIVQFAEIVPDQISVKIEYITIDTDELIVQPVGKTAPTERVSL